MSFRDEDLAAALAPIAGDPVRDAARVLAALPAPKRSPYRLLLATAAGVLVGFVADALLRGGASTATGDGPTPRGDGRQAVLAFATDHVQLVTDSGTEHLTSGAEIPYEHFVGTDKASAIVRLPHEVELRINHSTRLSLHGSRAVALTAGELWLRVPSSAGLFKIDTEEGTIETRGASLALVSGDNRVSLAVLDGEARFRGLAGEERALTTGQACESIERMLGAPHEAGFAWRHVSWQRELLLQSGRFEDALPYLYPLVASLEHDSIGPEAELELRRSGMLGAIAIGRFVFDRVMAPSAFHRRCVSLLCDIASVESLGYVLGALQSEDPESRVIAAEAVERLTAVPSGKDLEFWRVATKADRYDVLQSWREKLLVF
jgi:ferric-dicitrate binding protein FerR (iron transport regulator)